MRKKARKKHKTKSSSPYHLSCRLLARVRERVPSASSREVKSFCTASYRIESKSSNNPSNARLIERPLILLSNLLLFLGREIILNVERLSNLLRRLPLHHVRHRHARQIQQSAHVQVIRRQNDLKQRRLVHLDERTVELLHLLFALVFLLRRDVVFAILDHLGENF